MKKLCNFDRNSYLKNAEVFEAKILNYADEELSEMNNDAEDLAFELAYTRYSLARIEKAVCIFAAEELGNMNFENDDDVLEYVLSYED